MLKPYRTAVAWSRANFPKVGTFGHWSVSPVTFRLPRWISNTLDCGHALRQDVNPTQIPGHTSLARIFPAFSTVRWGPLSRSVASVLNLCVLIFGTQLTWTHIFYCNFVPKLSSTVSCPRSSLSPMISHCWPTSKNQTINQKQTPKTVIVVLQFCYPICLSYQWRWQKCRWFSEVYDVYCSMSSEERIYHGANYTFIKFCRQSYDICISGGSRILS